LTDKLLLAQKKWFLLKLKKNTRVFQLNLFNVAEWPNAFSLVVYNSDTMENVKYNFTATDKNKSKAAFLKTLCQQLACALCTTDPEDFLEEVEKVDIGLDQTITKSSTHSLTK